MTSIWSFSTPEGAKFFENKTGSLVLIIPSLSSGGAERVMSIMANAWVSRGRNVILVTLDAEDEKSFYPIHSQVRRISLGISGYSSSPVSAVINNLKRIRTVRRFLLSTQPFAVVSFISTTNILTLAAAFGFPFPVIVSERVDPSMHKIGLAWRILRRIFYRFASRIIVQNISCANYFRKWNLRLTVIPNPVPKVEWVHKNSQVRNEMFLSVGRLSSQKGHDLLIRAFGLIHEAIPDWSLTIYGEGPMREQLESLIKELGMTRRIFLPGRTKDLLSVMQECEIFVLASRYEGFPNALCEAMASGMAVIATDCPSGPREIVADEVNGLLVPPEDPKALGEAMKRLATNPDERRRLADRAPEIAETFSVESVMGMWDRVIMEAVSGNPASRP